jgi:hypothetical protein
LLRAQWGWYNALLLLGQISEALISVGIVLLNAFISLIQEVQAKRALASITLVDSPEGNRHPRRA